VALGVVSQDALQVSWAPPARDGGAPVSSYLVEWDPDPGVREVQVVRSAANTGANEMQTVQTMAADVDEVQVVTTAAAARAEVQTITTSAAPGETLGGTFTLELDTTSSGGSKQRSGVIAFNAEPIDYRASVAEILRAMSNIGAAGVQDVTVVGPDAQGGFTWRITFATAMGNVPDLKLSSNFLTGSGANVMLATTTQGNVITAGTFTLAFRGEATADIPFDASDAVMQQRLQALESVDAVNVVRTGPTVQNGYSWAITFTSNSARNSGNLPLLTVGSNVLLQATSATVTVTEASAGNQLTGSFKLSYHGLPTVALSIDCSAASMKIALETLGNVGIVDVVRSEPADPQGGYTWTVSFLTLKGSLSTLGTDLAALGETRTDGVVSKAVRVTRARPGTTQEVQDIVVSTTSSVSPSTVFYLRAAFAGQTTTTGPIPANALGDGTCMPTRPEVQQIHVTTADTTAQGGDYIVSQSTAIQLVYTSNLEGGVAQRTKPIYVNTASGDCSVGATAIAAELSAITGITGPVTVTSSAAVATQACTWSVTFNNQPGNLVQMTAIDASSAAGPSTTVVIGDDTVQLSTLTEGTINIIKTELERLPNVAQVTVSATPALTPNADKTCRWSVTFDGNAGDLPLMTVSVDVGATFGASKTASDDTVAVVSNTQGTSAVLGGVFALQFEGQRTGYMPFDASAAVVKAQLEILSTIGNVDVTRSSADPNNGYVWTVTFGNNLGDLEAIVPDALALTGTAPYIEITEHIKGVFPPFNSKDAANGKECLWFGLIE
jgi:hypothetical protein